jgi:hypothetical protein
VDVNIDECLFVGQLNEDGVSEESENNRICHWNGSLLHFSSSTILMDETNILNSSKGGVSVENGNVEIRQGRFEGNNPNFMKYPSLRRNLVCEGDGSVNLSSLDAGDGKRSNSSLWMILSEECEGEGILSERASSFFVPTIANVTLTENTTHYELTFTGKLLIPCNLTFSLLSGSSSLGEFNLSSFENETKMVGVIPLSAIPPSSSSDDISVSINFGSGPIEKEGDEIPSIPLQNKTTQSQDEEKESETLSERIPSPSHSSDKIIQREELLCFPSPASKLERFTVPSPSHTKFLLKDGYFRKFGLFPSNLPCLISTSPFSTETPPLEEFRIFVSSISVVEEEKGRRDPFQWQILLVSLSSLTPSSFNCPTNEDPFIFTSKHDEKERRIPVSIDDVQFKMEHFEREIS